MQLNWRDVLLALSCLSGLVLWGLIFLAFVVNIVSGFRKPPTFPRGE